MYNYGVQEGKTDLQQPVKHFWNKFTNSQTKFHSTTGEQVSTATNTSCVSYLQYPFHVVHEFVNLFLEWWKCCTFVLGS